MSQALQTRQDRAEEISFEDIRRIPQGDGPTVYEVDAVNESGELRENLTLIPGIRYEATKDVRYRHSSGVIGKYTRRLCQVDDTAREELLVFLEEERAELQEKITELSEKDTRLMVVGAEIQRE